jgi:chemotaxis protein CheZ
MPVRQKIFRIESMQPKRAPQSAPAADTGAAAPNEDILAELKALRELMERQVPAAPSVPPLPKPDQMTIGDLSKLRHETDNIHRAISRTMQELADLHVGAFNDRAEGGRASRQLDAVVAGTERATQQILEAAEGIDDAANTLSASLKSEQEQALATDIRDHVVRIFEACNFQDLTGQRISKVLQTLQFVENSVARMMEIWGGHEVVKGYAGAITADRHEKKLLNGPKLDGEAGHASQQEIDAMFA